VDAVACIIASPYGGFISCIFGFFHHFYAFMSGLSHFLVTSLYFDNFDHLVLLWDWMLECLSGRFHFSFCLDQSRFLAGIAACRRLLTLTAPAI
jgi:hypothetical protein